MQSEAGNSRPHSNFAGTEYFSFKKKIANEGWMIWRDMHFSPIIKMDGTLVGIPSFSKDISERKEREELITQWKNG